MKPYFVSHFIHSPEAVRKTDQAQLPTLNLVFILQFFLLLGDDSQEVSSGFY